MSALWERLPNEPVEPRTIAACMPRQVPGGYMVVYGATTSDDAEGYPYLFVETHHRYHALSLGRDGDGEPYAWERVDSTETESDEGVSDAALRMGYTELLPEKAVSAKAGEHGGISTADYTGREYLRNAPNYDEPVFETMSEAMFDETGASLPLPDGTDANHAESAESEQYLAVSGLPDVDLGERCEVEVVGDARETVEGTVIQRNGESMVLDDGEAARWVYDSHVAASEAGLYGGGRDPVAFTDIDGVHEAKAEALLDGGFASVDELAAASQSEISEVEGIGNALAARIKAQVGDHDAPDESDDEGLGELFGRVELETEAIEQATRAVAEAAHEQAKANTPRGRE